MTSQDVSNALTSIENETAAKVTLVSLNDGYHKIKLANKDLYLTADSDDMLNWSTLQPESDDEEEQQVHLQQTWKIVLVSLEQREAENVEYHLIPQMYLESETKRALQINMQHANTTNGLTDKTKRLTSDEYVEITDFSYVNKQKWRIKGNGKSRKIYTSHGDKCVLCNDGSDKAMVSDSASDENSMITLVSVDPTKNLYKIMLTSSGLYLAYETEVIENSIQWVQEQHTYSNNHIWKLEAKDANIHNGADTAARLYDSSATDKDRSIRAYKLGREEFLIRYYAKEANNHKVLQSDEVHSLQQGEVKINIVSVYQDVGNEDQYFSSSLGTQNANRALELAESLGQPTDSAIYFAVDYDAASSTELKNVRDYFSAIKKVFNDNGNKYQIGVYGSGLVCRSIMGTYAQYSWLSCATGHWEYDQYDTPLKYNIKQAEKIYYNGKELDDCIAVGDDYGQWYK